MNEKGKIIRFPGNPPNRELPCDDDGVYNFEAWEPYQEFLDKEDYPGLVRYCEQQAERAPDDLYAQYYLGDAYVLNGEYEKAIEWLENAVNNGFLNHKFLAEYDPTFERIRRTERFVNLIEHMKQKLTKLDSF